MIVTALVEPMTAVCVASLPPPRDKKLLPSVQPGTPASKDCINVVPNLIWIM